MTNQLAHKTIEDFGRQWTAFTDNEGWYGSLELFNDIISPLLDLQELSGKDVADRRDYRISVCQGLVLTPADPALQHAR